MQSSDETKIDFDPQDELIRKELIEIVVDYLREEGFNNTAWVLQQEADVKMTVSSSLDIQMVKQTLLKRTRKAIMEGDWNEVEKLCTKYAFKNFKSFLYVVYKQKYFELIEKQEYQKAYNYLIERLKPLESRQADPQEFMDLCYLLTCKSVQDAPSFKGWDSDKSSSREKLVEQFASMLGLDSNNNSVTLDYHDHQSRSKENEFQGRCRLLELTKQAIAYQIDHSPHQSERAPQMKTLLTDYQGFVLPNNLRTNFIGHKDNVKCVSFVGSEGHHIVSGSSDNTLRLWKTTTGECLMKMTGHTSRIWDVDSNAMGNMIASASGDSSIKLWDCTSSLDDQMSLNCISTLSNHQGDVYTVRFHPSQRHIISGGYDKTARLYDVTTGQLKRAFVGHNSSISRAIFNPSGNLIITGSKDSTIKFWDISSGLCIRTIGSHLGEVTSIEMNSDGRMLLSGSKDNSNRLWEISTARPITRFKGHQNTTKNFVRAGFGPGETLVIGGSEDGSVYIWDIEDGDLLQKLSGHSGMVYSAVWNQRQMLMASCSHDGLIKTWGYSSKYQS